MSIVVDAFGHLPVESRNRLKNLEQVRMYLALVGGDLSSLAQQRYFEHAGQEIKDATESQVLDLFTHMKINKRQIYASTPFREWDLIMTCNFLLAKGVVTRCGYKEHDAATRPTQLKAVRCDKHIGIGRTCICGRAHRWFETSMAHVAWNDETFDIGRFAVLVRGGFTNMQTMHTSLPYFTTAHCNTAHAAVTTMKIRNMVAHMSLNMNTGITNEIATCILELLSDVRGTIAFERGVKFTRPTIRLELRTQLNPRRAVEQRPYRADDRTNTVDWIPQYQVPPGPRHLVEPRPHRPATSEGSPVYRPYASDHKKRKSEERNSSSDSGSFGGLHRAVGRASTSQASHGTSYAIYSDSDRSDHKRRRHYEGGIGCPQ